jgi:hypothetical protein
LRLCWEIGEKRSLIYCLMGLAWIEAAQDRSVMAAQLLGAASALANKTGFKLRPVDIVEYEHTASTTRNVLGDAQYDVAWRHGNAMSIEQAISLALNEEAGGMGWD